MSKFPLTIRSCAGCGIAFLGRGRAKWCTDRCRKDTLYVRNCVDCGSRLSSSDGNGSNAPTRCRDCAPVAAGAERKVWTRGACIAVLQAWAREHGEPPAIPDWEPCTAGHGKLHDAERSERAKALVHSGAVPNAHTVIREFGSWNAALRAAGFAPRAGHGGAGNEKRNRHYGKGIAKKSEILRLYREGLSYAEIAVRVPTTRQDVCWTVWNARKAGVDLPYRIHRAAA